MTRSVPRSPVVADDELLDLLGSRSPCPGAAGDPVVGLLSALADHADHPVPVRRRRRHGRRTVTAVTVAVLAASGVGAAAAGDLPGPDGSSVAADRSRAVVTAPERPGTTQDAGERDLSRGPGLSPRLDRAVQKTVSAAFDRSQTSGGEADGVDVTSVAQYGGTDARATSNPVRVFATATPPSARERVGAHVEDGDVPAADSVGERRATPGRTEARVAGRSGQTPPGRVAAEAATVERVKQAETRRSTDAPPVAASANDHSGKRDGKGKGDGKGRADAPGQVKKRPERATALPETLARGAGPTTGSDRGKAGKGKPGKGKGRTEAAGGTSKGRSATTPDTAHGRDHAATRGKGAERGHAVTAEPGPTASGTRARERDPQRTQPAGRGGVAKASKTVEVYGP
ncbi:hypothetical protein [Terracoccus luteus]|uniref:Uncharacterized protein n=1 Tax=Terracoccus luteus TaxID=53356 RepID=A0A839PS30_9MICO|nr:hypothetical protein [Terracoccus luteus]MBB2985604.1 hypothetical protein [Terracoccus luteus]MCP2171256.1 hypothetical protein [Terracoccus luteus]